MEEWLSAGGANEAFPSSALPGRGQGGANRSPARIRIPDPSGWKLDVLKGKDCNFISWRECFDLQAGSIWHGIDKVLEYIRDETKTVNESTFEQLLDIHLPDHVDESDANPADWKYKFISKKLFMVIHTHASFEVRKTIAESTERCGLEAYRLLSREFDPISADKGFALLERVLVIARWNVKGLEEEAGAFREAIKRLRELERRFPEEGQHQRRIVSGMIFARVSKRCVCARGISIWSMRFFTFRYGWLV